MIEPMHKYYFLVPQGDYLRFLIHLRQLGVVHVKGKQEPLPSGLQDRMEAQKRLQGVLDLLAKREVQPRNWDEELPEDGLELMKRYEDWTDEFDDREQELEEVNKKLEQWRPWGEFSTKTLEELAGAGLYIHFFSCPAKRWKPGWMAEYPIALVAEENGQAHFIYLSREAEPPELPVADAWPSPAVGTQELRERRVRLEDEKATWSDRLDQLAAHGIPAMQAALYKLQDNLQFTEVIHHSRQEADGHVMLLEGYVPDTHREKLEGELHKDKVLFLRDRPKPKDNPPVLLRNSGFSRLFEPIGELFSLPDYSEMDLTPYFAPFFMMFFGFCLGDAGYGLVMVLGATIYRRWARESYQPILRLLQWLGLATVIFGALTGTLFGLNLVENPLPGMEAARNFMLDSNQAFQLALVLGLVQILFGLVLKAMN
jgi:V/A-type H+-transporting ATPase subunit I